MMAKFSGVVGYSEGTVQTRPGVWEESIVEHHHTGDILRNTRQLRDGEHLNSDLSVSNTISMVADAYAREHFFAIRYVKWSGALWAVTEVEVESPRLLLRLGGLYNGPKPA